MQNTKHASPVAAARDLKRKYPGIDGLYAFLAAERVAIKNTDFTELQERTGLQIDCALVRQSDGNYAILANEDLDDADRKMATAQAAGHYVLHAHDAATPVIACFRNDMSDRARQAVKFASELLLSEKAVKSAYASQVIPVCRSLAEKLSVPERILRTRLDALGLAAL